MLKLVILHLLLLLMLPILWHYWEKSTTESAAKAAAARGHLNDTEQAYYETVFSYAMETVPKDGTYGWQGGGAAGNFRIGKKFTSVSQSTCRHYLESYDIRGVKGTTEGYGCKRVGDSGWCMIPENASAFTCALEPPRTSFHATMRRASDFVSDIFSGVQNLR